MSNSTAPAESLLPYSYWTEEALRHVVQDALSHAAEHGLPGEHHFYLTFRTAHPGVAMPGHLRARYPQEMTIVLQNRFWDLLVDEAKFSVGLSFNQVPSKLVIPYSAITGFHDPAVAFELRFQAQEEPGDGPTEHDEAENDGPTVVPAEDGSNVVSVDFKRKK